MAQLLSESLIWGRWII